MATINKKYIVEELHRKTGLSKRILKSLVDELLEEIKKTLELGEEIKIVRFGSFIPYKTKKRVGGNLLREIKALLMFSFSRIFQTSFFR